MRKFTLLIASLFITIGAMAQAELDLTQKFHDASYTYHSSTAGGWYGKCVTNTTPAITVECTDATKDVVGYATKDSYKRLWFQAGYSFDFTISEGYAITGYTVVTQSTTASNKSQFKYTTAEGMDTSPTQETSNKTITVSGLHTNTITFDLTGHSVSGTHGILIWSIVVNYTDLASEEEISDAKSVITEGVGYPKMASEEYVALNSLSYGTSTISQVNEAVNNYLACTNINMPVDGKAYILKNVQKSGAEWFFKFDAVNGITLSSNAEDAEIFICREKDGKYVFVNNSGKFFAHKGTADASKYVGVNSNKGYTDEYDQTYTANNELKYLNDFTLASQASNLFGGITLSSRRIDRAEAVNYVIHKSGVFDQANGTFYNDNYSSVIFIEEASYANTPKLNDVGTSELLTSDLHNKAMGTFSAPFATIVPDGVTAYYATDGDGYITLNAIVDGKAIPANTGVVLVADDAGEIVMSPAAGEEESDNSNNAFSHSAGAAKEIAAGCYVLSAKEGVAGFYATTAGIIAMNKAYVESVSGQNAIEIRLPGTTGIDQITDNREQSTVIYDLTGRRIEAITSPGIYIVDGVKKLVH